jgi:hypothetical protein
MNGKSIKYGPNRVKEEITWGLSSLLMALYKIIKAYFCHSGLDPESRNLKYSWTPAFAGVTSKATF